MRTLSILALAACLDTSPATEAVTEQALGGETCPIWQCGTNSPHIKNLLMHDANKYGVPNSAGFAIASFRKDFATYHLDVTDGRLIGRNNYGIGVLFGQQLVGSKILLHNQNTNEKFLVRVREVGTVEYWAKLATGPVTRESYLLDWVLTLDGINPAPYSRYVNVCKLASSTIPDYETLGLNGFHTVLFEGERIDAAAKTITGWDSDWFNIGCAGHALAKLELTGHTWSAQRHGFVSTTLDERQTALKMLVADYTGSGIPYTIAGMPLSWADVNGWMKQAPNVTTMEARWTPYGADCLDEPRAHAHFSQAIITAFPDTDGDVEAAMGDRRPPSCRNPDGTQLDGYHLVTMNVP